LKPSIKPSWLEKAEDTLRFHRQQLQSHERWKESDTASALNRASGSVSEDLKIARWLKTHREVIEGFKFAKEALKWIKEEERKRELE